MSLTLTPVPAFSDNYIWLLHDEQQALVVDPGDAAPVADYLDKHALRLAAILITHHHDDHIGGVSTLLQSYGHAATLVAGPADARIHALTEVVGAADQINIAALQLQFAVLAVPGHTRTHIAFHNDRWLFSGDTLFSAGCGRLFEGTPEQMQQSLDQLAALPGDLLLCCAHEYTASNCRFALTLEPDNQALQQRWQQVQQLRADNAPTLPVSLAAEITYNPFLRTRAATVAAAAARHAGMPAAQADKLPPARVMAIIRAWKDQF